jgi:hypothetical protein
MSRWQASPAPIANTTAKGARTKAGMSRANQAKAQITGSWQR